MKIDKRILRDLIEEDYNLYDIYIGDLEYKIDTKSLIGGHIEYKFTDWDNEDQYGLVSIERYIKNKRESNLTILL